MADNANAPASAPVGGGSPEPNKEGTPVPASLDTDKIMKRLDDLAKTQDNQRSMHDRQMTAIQTAMEASARPASGATEDDGDDGSGEAAPKPGLTPRQIADMRDTAITSFKVNHPDWQKYWERIEEIGSAKEAHKFLRYKSDPDTGDLVPDFYASLSDIREHIEMQDLRKQVDDANPANKQADNDTNQARSDANAIGGAPASIPEDALAAFQALSYNDKVKKLAEIGAFTPDPNDLPEALRKG